MQIIRHIPNFASDGRAPPQIATFKSRGELAEIAWVRSWLDGGATLKIDISDYRLMAFVRGGKEWWVVGRIIDASENELRGLGLPVAEYPPPEREKSVKVYSAEERARFAAARGARSR